MIRFALSLLIGLAAGAAPDAVGQRGVDQRGVTLTATTSLADVLPPVVGDLLDGTVLRVTVVDGTPGLHAVARQCTLVAEGFAGCRNVFPVLFDETGRAVFQYQLATSAGCTATATCVLVVTAEPGAEADGDPTIAFAFTVFGAPAPPPPQVNLRPEPPYEPHQSVEVVVGEVAPGTATRAAFCSDRCAAPVVGSAGADGRAVLVVTIGERCTNCEIRVVSGPSYNRVPVQFLPSPRPQLAASTVLAGLVAAAVLLLLAAWLILATDWRPPSEAATPEFDAADEIDEGARA